MFGVIGVIAVNAPVTVNGCITGSRWCQVDYGGVRGWAYSDYLATIYNGNQVKVGINTVALGLSTIPYSSAVAGITPAPAVASPPTLQDVPPAAVVGSTNATVISTPITLPAFVRTFVTNTPVTSAYFPGTLAIGTTLPPTIGILPVPQYQYMYAYVNGLPVLVDPTTRQIVYIVS
jgi:hypothetical protein